MLFRSTEAGAPPSQPWAGGAGHTHHLQEGEVAQTHVVVVDLDIEPADLARVHQALALGLVVDLGDVEPLGGGGVHAVVELAGEQVDAHDAEDEPEDEADEQHIHDGGDGSQEGIHHHLGAREGVTSRSSPRQVGTPSLLWDRVPTHSNQGARQGWALLLREGLLEEGPSEPGLGEKSAELYLGVGGW